LNDAEDRVLEQSSYFSAGQTFLADNSALVNSTGKNVASAIAASSELKSIEESVRGFAESSKVLMNVLDDISKLHPFIGGS
jgi:hypothetical protein